MRDPSSLQKQAGQINGIVSDLICDINVGMMIHFSIELRCYMTCVACRNPKDEKSMLSKKAISHVTSYDTDDKLYSSE